MVRGASTIDQTDGFAFDEVVTSSVIQEITKEFEFTNSVAQLQVTAGASGLWMNGSSVDEAGVRKVLFSGVSMAKDSLVFGTAVGLSEFAPPGFNCTFWQFQNWGASFSNGFTYTNAQPGVCRSYNVSAKDPQYLGDVLSGSANATAAAPDGGCMRYWDVDEAGRPQSLLAYNDYNVCQRSWFQASLNATAWFGPFQYSEGGILGLSLAVPFYGFGSDGTRATGVSACFIVLSNLEDFLVDSFGNTSTFIYLVDNTTSKLVATSRREVAVRMVNGKLTNIDAHDASLPWIPEIERYLLQHDVDADAGTVHVMDLPRLGLSWVQSQVILTSDEDYKLTAWNGTWRLVVVENVDCPTGFVADTNLSSDGAVPSVAVSGGQCMECSSIKGAHYTSDGGDARVCNCQPGYYFDEAGSCRSCPTGAVCQGGWWLPYPQDGRWIDASETRLMAVAQECFDGSCRQPTGRARQCFSSEATLQSTNCSSDVTCNKAHGRLCGICDDGYYRGQDGSCYECEGKSLINGGNVVAYLVLGIVLIGAATFAHRHPMLRRQFNLLFNPGICKIALIFAQIVGSVSWSTSVEWPQPFRAFASLLNVAMLDVFTVLPISCAAPAYSFYDTVISSALVPMAVIAILLVGVTVHADWNELNPKIRRSRCEYIVIMVAYVVLPSVSLTMFRLFLCEPFEDGKSFLIADLELQCYTSKWASVAVFAGFMIALYPVGIPLCFLVLLQRNRKAIVAHMQAKSSFIIDDQVGHTLKKLPPSIAPFEFLFWSYRAECFRAEVYECVRRLVLASLLVFFGDTPEKRAFAGSVLALFFVTVSREYLPFRGAAINVLYYSSQWAIFFTLLVAFMLSGAPFGVDGSLVASLLLVANVAIFAVALRNQIADTRAKLEVAARNQRLHDENDALKAELDEFRNNVKSIVTVAVDLNAAQRHELLLGTLGDVLPPEIAGVLNIDSMSADEQRRTIVAVSTTSRSSQAMALDLRGLADRGEAINYLEAVATRERTGVHAEWYWQETADRVAGHDPAMVWEGTWVRYADSVAAQLEAAFAQGKKWVEVDVHGRIVSTQDGNKPNGAPDSGTKYVVDVQAMTQTNVQTKFLRAVRRREVAVAPAPAPAPAHHADTQLADQLSVDHFDVDADASLPAFPRDLFAADEPVLLVRRGQLIQVQKRRTDGWWYGFVLMDPDEGPADPTAPPTAKQPRERTLGADAHADQGVEMTALLGPSAPHDDVGGMDLAAETKADTEDHPLLALEDGRGEEPEAERGDGGNGSGWFPASFARHPTARQLRAFQNLMGGGDEATAALAPPITWTMDTEHDPLAAKLYDVAESSDEWDNVTKQFRATMDLGKGVNPNGKMGDGYPNSKIFAVKRVENLGLWQTYAAKRQTMVLRGESEGIDTAAYERCWLFHGAVHDVVPKICQMGLNRSFAGKNACLYGRGVYFARDASYSAFPQYAAPDPHGVQRMFMCRVLTGEYCVGTNQQIVPDVRKGEMLYDSTVNSLENPILHVTFNDAQAYPEYLIEFNCGVQA